MMTHEASERTRLYDLWRLNRARFQAAGWRISAYLALPMLAIRTALFPTDPPAWAPAAPPLPLLPAQQAVQERLDAERAALAKPRPLVPAQQAVPARLDAERPVPARRRPVGLIHVTDLLPAEPAVLSRTRKVGSNRITPKPLVLRNGFWLEPLTHHAHGPRRHYAPRPCQEA